MATFEQLVAEAQAAAFSGWDFSWLAARSTAEPLPWSYRAEVARYAADASAMLDMGTGGGEWLSRLAPRPGRTVATEGWPPNVPVAARRLRPAGVWVVQDEGAADNSAEDASRGRLPFRDGAFPLITNRHEAFRAAEVSRVLAPGGTFITQQVDTHTYDELYRLLGLPVPDEPGSWLPLARRQLRDAGLTVRQAVAGQELERFNDVAAIIYYLRVVSWAVPEFTVDRFAGRLRELHATPGAWPVAIRQRRFLVTATKDVTPG
jgi:SAM-dependent methyltransferase